MADDVVAALGLEEPERVLPRRQRKPVVDYVNAMATPAPLTSTFSLLSAEMLKAWPRMKYRVKGIAPAKGLMSVYGPWGSGKSFLVQDMEAAIGEGRDWFGHKSKPGRVVHLALEGADGVRQRIEAWEQYHGRPFPDAVRFVFDTFRLCDPVSVTELAAAIERDGGADVVVIDTLNRAAPEVDENASRDMGLMVEGSRYLQELIGGLVILVAHSGKDQSKGLRGHSSLPAALDAAIELRNGLDGREWSVSKLKDGQDGKSHRFRLETVELGEDEDGDPITSCVVLRDLAYTPLRPPLPGGGNQRIVYDAIGPVLKDFGTYGHAGVPPTRPSIETEAAILKLRDRLPVEPARRAERAREAIKGLIARKVLCCNEGRIWLA